MERVLSTQGSIGGAKGQAVTGTGPGVASLGTAARGSGLPTSIKMDRSHTWSLLIHNLKLITLNPCEQYIFQSLGIVTLRQAIVCIYGLLASFRADSIARLFIKGRGVLTFWGLFR